MAEGFERRFRQQAIDVFQPGRLRKVWVAFGTAYVRFGDENSNPRSLDQQLLNVLTRARRDGVIVPWCFVLADAAVRGTLACRRGYTILKSIVERRDEFGVLCAEMIAYEGQSAIDVARLFNEHKVGGKQTWSDGRVRQHYSRPRLVGKDILHMTKQVVNRNTAKKRTIRLPEKDWMYRDVPHL